MARLNRTLVIIYSMLHISPTEKTKSKKPFIYQNILDELKREKYNTNYYALFSEVILFLYDE